MTAGANILVVDDTLENVRLLSSMLGRQGYEVRPVTSGRQALVAAEREVPDLILLDINMPDLDGYEVCSRLKARTELRDVPVIFLTALNDVRDKVKAFEAGGVDYITKPFQFEEVHARVQTHVSLRRASVALEQSFARLQALERLRDDLVHMVVHDMRSPLAVTIGELELLEGANVAALGDDIAEGIASALRCARGVNRMANELLDISRLESGKLPISPVQCDLVELASSVCRVLAGLDHARRLEVESSGPVWVTCDVDLVRRVMENLVSNAVKHSPSGGFVTVSFEVGAGRTRVAVADDGPGVAPDARPRLFEKFGCVDGTRPRRFHSAGLGLAFCRLAVEAMGGSIAFSPREPQGSVFWFELPCAPH
ncbi:MAG TPA: hybrid sensor histidine kinase/response regulator [Polyangiaceae bacterium]|nr:hybrid sensor histidine kinase/response regulator [Polyangiaceae bacterium]